MSKVAKKAKAGTGPAVEAPATPVPATPVPATAPPTTNHQPPDASTYLAFLRAKMTLATRNGFDVDPSEIHPILKPHQRDIVQWAVAGGRRGIFARFGLGKSLIQLSIAQLILARHGGCGLIVCPLGVRQEFLHDAKMIGMPIKFVRKDEEISHDGLYLTNYESVREGKINPSGMTMISLDEASCLRGFGGTKTFREFMGLFEGKSTYRFVATAVPSPNEYLELLAYAAFLDIGDVAQLKTAFFKRDSTKADHLTIHKHKEAEFWIWLSSWAIFLQRPSELGYSDDGYTLPPLKVEWHEVPSDHTQARPDQNGQGRMFKENVLGLSEAAREKRDSIKARLTKIMEIVKDSVKTDQLIIWCDLNYEQDEIEKALTGAGISFSSMRGSQGIEEREKNIERWKNKETTVFLSKLSMYGSGTNLQQCHTMLFGGIGFKFSEVIQGCFRIQRYLQEHDCTAHFVFTESEHSVKHNLETKWSGYTTQIDIMSDVIREHGLACINPEETLRRTIGVERTEEVGEQFKAIRNDSILECANIATNSVDLIITSIPFSFQYEYSPSYNDLGCTESNDHFWAQMDFLSPNLLRVLAPGRVMAIHVKDRIVPGGLTGLGFQTLHPFHAEAIYHYRRHGFAFLGMKTVVTDVVRENNQTYRLGWTEQCKDGSRMGCGVPEYVLLFRKPQTDRTHGYADKPVVKDKPQAVDAGGEPQPFDTTNNWKTPVPGTGYSRSKWQLDAHGFMRDGGNRLLTPDELANLPHAKIYKLWRDRSKGSIYDHAGHVALCEEMDQQQRLPATFMLMPPHSWHPDVWTDIARMRTLNMEQERRGQEMHLCPLQFDIIDRLVNQFSMPGETVLDPFGGLMSVPYRAIKLGRRGIGVELNAGYARDGARYCRMAEANQLVPTLFEMLEADDDDGDGDGDTAAGIDVEAGASTQVAAVAGLGDGAGLGVDDI